MSEHLSDDELDRIDRIHDPVLNRLIAAARDRNALEKRVAELERLATAVVEAWFGKGTNRAIHLAIEALAARRRGPGGGT